MKNGLLILAGVAGLAAFSWATLLLVPQRQYGGLAPAVNPEDGFPYPYGTSGEAQQGRRVYQDLGCVYCHTQQVRSGSSDIARKWGARESFARDYVRDQIVLLGSSRLGPDLRNVGARLGDTAKPADYAAWFYKLLYDPQTVAPGTNMPAYSFLFEVRKVRNGQASPKALPLTGRFAPPAGYEIVPTHRADVLVAYLQSLKDSYDYPLERLHNAPPAAPAKEGGH